MSGLDRLPADGPAVIVASHASTLDGLVLSAVLPLRIAFVAKSELIESRVARPFLKALGTAFVERFDPKRAVEDTRRLAGMLEGGQPLMFFAEGCVWRARTASYAAIELGTVWKPAGRRLLGSIPSSSAVESRA